jgi:hypothetical protein
MAISSVRSISGLVAFGDHTGPRYVGSVTIGQPQTMTYHLEDAIAYSAGAIIADIGSAFVIDTATGADDGSDTWVAGSAQIETATVVAASGATSAGNCSLTLTSGVVTGASSGLAVVVALTTASNTAAKVATALAAGLNANAAVAAHYTATTSTANVILTRKVDANGYYQAADATLNLAIPAGLGITAAATSAGTNAGTATSGVYLNDADGKDWEGTTLPTLAVIDAMLIELTSGGGTATIGTEVFTLPALFPAGGGALVGTMTISATVAKTQFKITVIGTPGS